jgi:hypothetical protein
MYIDPKSKDGLKQAEKFWHYIWESQKWNVAGRNQKSSC